MKTNADNLVQARSPVSETCPYFIGAFGIGWGSQSYYSNYSRKARDIVASYAVWAFNFWKEIGASKYSEDYR